MRDIVYAVAGIAITLALASFVLSVTLVAVWITWNITGWILN